MTLTVETLGFEATALALNAFLGVPTEVKHGPLTATVHPRRVGLDDGLRDHRGRLLGIVFDPEGHDFIHLWESDFAEAEVHGEGDYLVLRLREGAVTFARLIG